MTSINVDGPWSNSYNFQQMSAATAAMQGRLGITPEVSPDPIKRPFDEHGGQRYRYTADGNRPLLSSYLEVFLQYGEAQVKQMRALQEKYYQLLSELPEKMQEQLVMEQEDDDAHALLREFLWFFASLLHNMQPAMPPNEVSASAHTNENIQVATFARKNALDIAEEMLSHVEEVWASVHKKGNNDPQLMKTFADIIAAKERLGNAISMCRSNAALFQYHVDSPQKNSALVQEQLRALDKEITAIATIANDGKGKPSFVLVRQVTDMLSQVISITSTAASQALALTCSIAATAIDMEDGASGFIGKEMKKLFSGLAPSVEESPQKRALYTLSLVAWVFIAELFNRGSEDKSGKNKGSINPLILHAMVASGAIPTAFETLFINAAIDTRAAKESADVATAAVMAAVIAQPSKLGEWDIPFTKYASKEIDAILTSIQSSADSINMKGKSIARTLKVTAQKGQVALEKNDCSQLKEALQEIASLLASGQSLSSADLWPGYQELKEIYAFLTSLQIVVAEQDSRLHFAATTHIQM